MKAKPLTFEQTQGTKTYYLPFERGPLTPPEVTIMVRQLPDGTFVAGVSVCSNDDPFTRVEGRFRAYNRMLHAPYGKGAFRAANSDDLTDQISAMLDGVTTIHYNISVLTMQDLEIMSGGLQAAFEKLAKNREAHPAKRKARSAKAAAAS